MLYILKVTIEISKKRNQIYALTPRNILCPRSLYPNTAGKKVMKLGLRIIFILIKIFRIIFRIHPNF